MGIRPLSVPGGGAFEPEVSSSLSGIQMLYLLIWKCFKIKSSLLRVNGSDEKGLQGLGFKAWSMLESRSFFFSFSKKKFKRQIWFLGGASDRNNLH